MNILETCNLTKKYKDFYALKGVNMHIEKGDIYGFVGENGAGKTTVIRIVTGLAHPTSGAYSLFNVDKDDNKINEARRKISAIVEEVSLNRNMTALENMKMQAAITNTNKSDEELIDLINLVGLDYEAIKNKKTKDYSLGMRQRLGLAIVMVQDPELIILDEPMNGLDPQGVISVREAILKLHEMGVTFLISSHILSELDKICNKIGVISKGKLLEELTINELHAKESTRIVIESNEIERVSDVLLARFDFKKCNLMNNRLTIRDKADINELIKELVNQDVKIDKIQTIDESIEDYYINLIKGGKDK